MQEQINERVTVLCLYDQANGKTMPVKLRWQGKEYYITKLGYYHRYKEGRALIHSFSVSTDAMFFKLNFNSETLVWILEEVTDGLAN